MGRRRGRNLKAIEQSVNIIRPNSRLETDTRLFTNVNAIIKRNNAPSDSQEEGGLVRLTNEYLCWISPPLTGIQNGDILVVQDTEQNLKVRQEQTTRDMQRLFLIDESENYN